MIFVPMFLAILVDRVSHPTLAATYRLILLHPGRHPRTADLRAVEVALQTSILVRSTTS